MIEADRGELVHNPLVRPLEGTWTYRSFINDPDIAKAFNDFEFGRGELTIDSFTPGSFSGRLAFGDTYQFKLYGSSAFGNPYILRFQGIGDTADS